MIRLPLRELEEALANRAEYRTKLARRAPSLFRYSYFSALRNAIYRYHRFGTTPLQAREYLSDSLARFKNASQAADTMDQFDWYLQYHRSCGLTTFETRLRVEVPLPSKVGSNAACYGQVDRIDIRPSGGYYAAWLFRSKDHLNWALELRMPLTQLAVAKKLDVHSDKVTIGIYSFHERYVEEHHYSREDIASSRRELESLLIELAS